MTNQLSLEEALKGLEAEGASPRQRPAGPDHIITSLPINNISKRTAVFQPRSLEGFLSEDEEFIRDLTKVLKNSDGKSMDPITVWYGGRNFYVIDGHHRLEAYKRYWGQNCREKAIPCAEFKGSLIEAVEFAGQANHKNKLPMRQDMRLNFAWRLVCISDLTADRIKDAAGVALRTVRTMRAKLREKLAEHANEEQAKLEKRGKLEEQLKLGPKPEERAELERAFKATEPVDEISRRRQLGEMTWKDVRNDDIDKPQPEDWEKKQLAEAHRMAKRLLHEFGGRGGRLHQKAHILARALVICDDKLPLKMVQSEAWEDHMEDIKIYADAQLGEYELEEIEQEEEDEGVNPRTKVYFKSKVEF